MKRVTIVAGFAAVVLFAASNIAVAQQQPHPQQKQDPETQKLNSEVDKLEKQFQNIVAQFDKIRTAVDELVDNKVRTFVFGVINDLEKDCVSEIKCPLCGEQCEPKTKQAKMRFKEIRTEVGGWLSDLGFIDHKAPQKPKANPPAKKKPQ